MGLGEKYAECSFDAKIIKGFGKKSEKSDQAALKDMTFHKIVYLMANLYGRDDNICQNDFFFLYSLTDSIFNSSSTFL